MSCRYGVYANGQVILEYWVGSLDKPTIIEQEQKQSLDPSIASSYQVLAHCKNCQFDLFKGDITDIVEALHQQGSSRAQRVAFYLDTEQESQFEHIHQYSSEGWSSGVEIMIFFSLDSACAWLELDATNVKEKFIELKNEAQNMGLTSHELQT
ncbi:hypothetical protein [Bermanella sp. R86510]|uniref:hypothetical protein n=1 Tax=unclassified Bermanella TaxID=2627862 RepID=UPI0037C5C635